MLFAQGVRNTDGILVSGKRGTVKPILLRKQRGDGMDCGGALRPDRPRSIS